MVSEGTELALDRHVRGQRRHLFSDYIQCRLIPIGSQDKGLNVVRFGFRRAAIVPSQDLFNAVLHVG